jgi:hypothetical protein
LILINELILIKHYLFNLKAAHSKWAPPGGDMSNTRLPPYWIKGWGAMGRELLASAFCGTESGAARRLLPYGPAYQHFLLFFLLFFFSVCSKFEHISKFDTFK